MNLRRLIILSTILVISMLCTQIVYGAAAGRRIMIYNIDMVNGLQSEHFETLRTELASEGFEVDHVSRKEVPHLTKELISQYSQVWIFETDADKDRRHEYDFNAVELDNLLSFVRDEQGGLLLAAEEDFAHASQPDGMSLFEGVLYIVGGVIALVATVLSVIFTLGLGLLWVVPTSAATITLFIKGSEGISGESWQGDRTLFGIEATDKILEVIDYGQVSFTNHINQVSSMFGVVFIGLTEKYNCKTSTRYNTYTGSGLARQSIQEPDTRNDGAYGPFCVQGVINGVGGRVPPDKCPCIQVEPQPVAESLINKSHKVFENVETLYIDGREPMILPFRQDVLLIPIGISPRVRSDTENHHVFAITVPHTIFENGAYGKLYFESSWTRFTNNYPTELQQNIEQGDTLQYAKNIANWLEPSPDFAEGTCRSEKIGGDWKNTDNNIATVEDNCCYEGKVGTIIDGGRFACIEE